MQTQLTKLQAKQANLEIGHEAIYIERNLGLLGMPHGAEMIRYADIMDVSVKSGFFAHHLRIETKDRTLEFVTGNKRKLGAHREGARALTFRREVTTGSYSCRSHTRHVREECCR
jgi:hypothetical protein